MIICPNCNGENADHSAHCGHCGHQLTEGGKKTMFGMAALDSSQITKAAEEAKAARAAGALPGPPSLNFPKTLGASSDAPVEPSVGDDPYAKTEMMASVQTTALEDSQGGAPPMTGPPGAAPAPDPFADDFAALEAQYGDEPPVDPSPMSAAPPSAAPSDGPALGGPPAGGPPVGDAPSGPNAFGPPPGGAMVKAPIGALEKPEKSKAPLIIIGVLALFGVMGCIGSVAAYLVMGT